MMINKMYEYVIYWNQKGCLVAYKKEDFFAFNLDTEPKYVFNGKDWTFSGTDEVMDDALAIMDLDYSPLVYDDQMFFVENLHATDNDYMMYSHGFLLGYAMKKSKIFHIAAKQLEFLEKMAPGFKKGYYTDGRFKRAVNALRNISEQHAPVTEYIKN